MDVILLERIEKLGQMGDVVKVKDGFARNFLLPQRKALRANKENLSYFESRRAQLEAENLERKSEAEAVASKLEGLVVPMVRAAGDSGQLYGSVTARDISEAVTEAGVTIGRGQVALDRALKTLGLEAVRVVLHPEVAVSVTVNIARSLEEAEQQKLLGRAVGSDEGLDDDDEDDAAEQAAGYFAPGAPQPDVEPAPEAAAEGAEEETASA